MSNEVKTNIHGHSVYYEHDDHEAIRYLMEDIQPEEARVFFDQAKMRGKAEFETDHDMQYTLTYHSGAYKVEKRSSGGSGWF